MSLWKRMSCDTWKKINPCSVSVQLDSSVKVTIYAIAYWSMTGIISKLSAFALETRRRIEMSPRNRHLIIRHAVAFHNRTTTGAGYVTPTQFRYASCVHAHGWSRSAIPGRTEWKERRKSDRERQRQRGLQFMFDKPETVNPRNSLSSLLDSIVIKELYA